MKKKGFPRTQKNGVPLQEISDIIQGVGVVEDNWMIQQIAEVLARNGFRRNMERIYGLDTVRKWGLQLAYEFRRSG